MALSIVALTPADWQLFRDVRLASLADAPHAFATRLSDEARNDEAAWRAKLATRTQFIARDEHILGTAGAAHDGNTLELISMWVAPTARCRGVGEALVRHIIALARSSGCHQILLEVAEDNPDAQRLYTRCGFSPTGARGPIRPGSPRMRAEMRLHLSHAL